MSSVDGGAIELAGTRRAAGTGADRRALNPLQGAVASGTAGPAVNSRRAAQRMKRIYVQRNIGPNFFAVSAALIISTTNKRDLAPGGIARLTAR